MDPLAIALLVILGIAAAVVLGLTVENSSLKKQVLHLINEKLTLQAQNRKLLSDKRATQMTMGELAAEMEKRINSAP